MLYNLDFFLIKYLPILSLENPRYFRPPVGPQPQFSSLSHNFPHVFDQHAPAAAFRLNGEVY